MHWALVQVLISHWPFMQIVDFLYEKTREPASWSLLPSDGSPKFVLDPPNCSVESSISGDPSLSGSAKVLRYDASAITLATSRLACTHLAWHCTNSIALWAQQHSSRSSLFGWNFSLTRKINGTEWQLCFDACKILSATDSFLPNSDNLLQT